MKWYQLFDPADWLTGILLSLAAFFTYCSFSPAGLVAGDGSELAYGIKYFAPVHPPGYPLYRILGNAFIEVGQLDFVTGSHYFSALFMSLSLFFTFLFLRRRSISLFSAFVAVGALGLSPVVWPMAVQAEVYSLALFFLAGTLLIWDFVGKSGKGRYLLWFWVGLSLTHHPLGMINVVFAIHASVTSDRRFDWVRQGGLFVLPGVLYLTLLLPGGSFPFNWSVISLPEDVIGHMLGGSFTRFFWAEGMMTPLYQAKRGLVGHFSVVPFVWLIPWLLGYRFLVGREKLVARVQFIFVGVLLFYGVPDIMDFFVPSYLFTVMVLGRGLEAIHQRMGPGVYGGFLVAGVLSIVCFGWLIGFQYDRSHNNFFEGYAKEVNASVSRGTIVTDWATFTPLRFYQLDRGYFSDVRLIPLPIEFDLETVAKTHADHDIPLYVTVKKGWKLPERYHIEKIHQKEGLYRVTR